jgi:hypothetical protein
MRKIFYLLAIAVIVVVVVVATAERNALPEIDGERFESLKTYLDKNALAPDAYVISKFEDHDVVILGERHKVKHQLLFIQALIPKLYEANVYFLATEFGRREDQPLIDSLLAMPEYDESLAREIVFRQFVHWGYQEYVDVYKAAWELNHSLPAGVQRFRILGMNDSPDWSYVQQDGDRQKDEIKKKVWAGCGEKYWAEVILDRVERGERVAVHCGIHHGFTEFKQPVFDQDGNVIRREDRRMGNYLYASIGKRAITVFMHAPWEESYSNSRLTYPADGYIDALMARLGPEYYPVGFDTRGTPFGDLPCEDSVYGDGYENLVLKTFCDGYIFSKPFSEYEGVTPIPDFVNEGNIERARQLSWMVKYRTASPADFYWSAARDAAIPIQYKDLQ